MNPFWRYKIKRFFLNHDTNNVFAYPTEGVYGLGCCAFDLFSIQQIEHLKRKRASQKTSTQHLKPPHSNVPYAKNCARKAFIILVHPQHRLSLFSSVKLSEIIDFQQSLKYPNPITWLLPANSSCPDFLQYQNKVAIRVSNDPYLNCLLKYLKKPLISTSCNLSGYPPARSSIQAKRMQQAFLTKGYSIPLLTLPRKLPFNSHSKIYDWNTKTQLR